MHFQGHDAFTCCHFTYERIWKLEELNTFFKLWFYDVNASPTVKLDLNKKYFPKQKTIQNFTIDAQGFR